MHFNIRNAALRDHLTIRPLQKEIAELHYEGRPELFKPEPRYYSEETFARMLSDPRQFIFIAEDKNERVVGYAFACIMPVRNHPTYVDFDRFYIDDICVLEECRGLDAFTYLDINGTVAQSTTGNLDDRQALTGMVCLD